MPTTGTGDATTAQDSETTESPLVERRLAFVTAPLGGAAATALVAGIVVGDELLRTVGLAGCLSAYLLGSVANVAAIRAGRDPAKDSVRDGLLTSRYGIVFFAALFGAVGAVIGAIVGLVGHFVAKTGHATGLAHDLGLATGAGAVLGIGAVLVFALLSVARHGVRRLLSPPPGVVRPTVRVVESLRAAVGRALCLAAAGACAAAAVAAALRDHVWLYAAAAALAVGAVAAEVLRRRAVARFGPARRVTSA